MPSPAQRVTLDEVTILRRLLVVDQRGLWTRAELEHAVPGDPLDVSDALTNLYGVGVIHLTEDLVTLSRAARRTADLTVLL
jgi:hypothetical protein